MDQYEGREEGVFPNRVPTLFGKHESQTKAQRTWDRLAVSPSLYTHKYFPSRVSVPMELGIKKKRHSLTKSIQQRNHYAKISASCLPNKSHNAAGMGDDLEKFSKSFEEAMPDTEKNWGKNSDVLEHLRSLTKQSIQQRNHCAKISASCLPNKSHNAAGMGDDLEKISKSLESFEEAMPDTETWDLLFPPPLYTHAYFPSMVSAPMELGIKKKRHSPTKSIQQRSHCAKISASCLPNKSHNAAGMGDDLEKISKSLEEAMPDTEKNWGKNSDVLEHLRSLTKQRDFASGDLPEFGQSYGCPQTDNIRHMDNNVDETFYNRE